MPDRHAAALVGASSLTLAAIPPLGGFVSEWFTFEALLQGFRMPTLLSRLLCALAAAALALTAGRVSWRSPSSTAPSSWASRAPH